MAKQKKNIVSIINYKLFHQFLHIMCLTVFPQNVYVEVLNPKIPQNIFGE